MDEGVMHVQCPSLVDESVAMQCFKINPIEAAQVTRLKLSWFVKSLVPEQFPKTRHITTGPRGCVCQEEETGGLSQGIRNSLPHTSQIISK